MHAFRLHAYVKVFSFLVCMFVYYEYLNLSMSVLANDVITGKAEGVL